MLFSINSRIQRTNVGARLRSKACAGLLFVVFAQAPAVAAAEAQPQFDIFEWRITGNTVLNAIEIERALYEFLGPQGDMARVGAARTALEKLYKDAGYQAVSVDIPEQTVDRGIVMLRVSEGSIERVRVEGARYFSHRDIREAVPAARAGAVLNVPALTRELNALNARSRDRVVAPVLKSGSRPGTLALDLRVQDELPLHGGIEINNDYSPNTSRARLTARLSYDNLFQNQDTASIGLQMTPDDPNEVRTLVATYLHRFTNSNRVLSLYAVDSSSDISAVGDIGVIGEGNVVGLRLIQPLTSRAPSWSHTLAGGVDYKNFGDDTDVGGIVLNKDVQYWKFLLSFASRRDDEASRVSFQTGIDFGVRKLGNRTAEFTNKRVEAEPNFFVISADYSGLFALPWWGLSLDTALAAQWAETPLISNEQFGLGGRQTVRGYLESESLADYGISTRLAVLSPNLARGEALTQWIRTAQAHLFGDWGAGAIHEPLPSQDEHLYFGSAGFGLQVNGTHGWRGDLEIVWPLMDAVQTQSGDLRVLGRFMYDF